MRNVLASSVRVNYEAIIYEMGQVRLGSSFFRETIDNLRLSAKWKIVPRLAYGQKLYESKSLF